MEYVDPYSTYDYEYSVVHYYLVKRFLGKVLKENEKLTRDQFVQLYQKTINGTKIFGNRVRSIKS